MMSTSAGTSTSWPVVLCALAIPPLVHCVVALCLAAVIQRLMMVRNAANTDAGHTPLPRRDSSSEQPSDAADPMARPGLGLPLVTPDDKAFPSAVLDWKHNTPTLREVSMYWLVNTLTDKPEWERKVFDDEIVAKWKAEVAEFAARGADEAAAAIASHEFGKILYYPPVPRGFSDEMFDYCIAELKDKARIADGNNGWVSVLDGAAPVIKSDRAVPADIKEGFKALAAKLEDVPEASRDWHPGSDDKVLDLVHPSLWPLVYGKTRVVEKDNIGVKDAISAYASGSTIDVPNVSKTGSHDQSSRLWSTKFQWLPAEVDITVDGKATISSYINNLHPEEHASAYPIIEGLISAALPALDGVYSRAMTWKAVNDAADGLNAEALKAFSRIECTGSERTKCAESCDHSMWSDRPEDVEPGADDYDANRRWFESTHRIIQPEPRPYKFIGIDSYKKEGPWFDTSAGEAWMWPQANDEREIRIARFEKLREDTTRTEYQIKYQEGIIERLIAHRNANTVPPVVADPSGRRLQFIVKLANIHLTPEKPTYDGGSWHIEGQLNEHIVGTVLYYYDSENITESKLGFRVTTNAEQYDEGGFEYEQSDHEPFFQLYGPHPGMGEDTTELALGDVVTREDRCIVFPNVFRHRVAPFKLVDPTKPGHRKIVALFLVDPAVPVISTAYVPPQQLHWGRIPAVENKLPPEVAQMVYSDLGCPYSLTEAKKLRAELIEERKAQEVIVDELVKEGEWCFCEH